MLESNSAQDGKVGKDGMTETSNMSGSFDHIISF